jgi:tripartite ATP-independent transporter DctP family solute receptor
MQNIAKVVLAAAFAAAMIAASGERAQAQQTVLIGNATANDTQAAANDKFAALITQYSNGRLKASARHGSSLGSIAQMLAALQAGSVHGMIFPAGFMSATVPEISSFDLPFLLPGEPAKITAFAAQSKAAAEMIKLAEKKGIHIIGFNGIGPQSLLTKFPVHAVADLHGKKFRIIPSPPRVGAYQDWGAVPRPMEFSEVYTALQQGTIDGLDNPPDVIFKMKHHEVAKYFTITEHNAFVSNVIVSKVWYDGLSKDLQAAVDRAGHEAIAFADEDYTKTQKTSLEAMAKVITVTKMPPAELQKMRDLTRNGVWKRMEKDPVRGPMVKLLEEDVARFTKK